MRVEILPHGVGGGPPIVLDATVVMITHDDGTPIAVAGAYGPEGGILASTAEQTDFNRVLRRLGIARQTVCDRIELPPPPPGARLLRTPE